MRLLWDASDVFGSDCLSELFEDDQIDLPQIAPERIPGRLELGASSSSEHFHHPKTKFKSVRAQPHSANAVFHAVTHDNHDYIIKPLSGASKEHQPEHWAARNAVSGRIMDAMGKSHMGVESFHGVVPNSDRMKNGRVLPVDDGDSPEKRRRMHGSHVDMPAIVTRFAADTIPLAQATPEQLSKVDGSHRLAGIVHHILMGNVDGHHRNVLLNTKSHHPVHIDDDVSLASHHQSEYMSPEYSNRDGTPKNPEGKKAIMSVYGPGEDLDYTKGVLHDPATGQSTEIGQVGVNYPDEIVHMLKLASAGKLSDGLSDEDHGHLIENANDLLALGLEGTLERRHIVPTYRKQDDIVASLERTP